MASNNEFNIQLGASIDLQKVNKSLDQLKQKSSKVDWLDLSNGNKQLQTHITYVDKLGNTYERFTKTVKDSNGNVINNYKNLNNEIQKNYDILVKTSDGASKVSTSFQNVEKTLGQWEQMANKTVLSMNQLEKETVSVISNIKPIEKTGTYIEKITNELGITTTVIDTVDSSSKRLITTIREYEGAFGELVTETEVYDANAQQVVSTNKQIEVGTKQVEAEIKKLDSEVKKVGDSFQKTATQSKNMGQSFGNIVEKVAKFYLASLPIRAVQTAISESIQTVKEFDEAFTELAKVIDLSGESLDRYVASLDEVGQRVARSRTELVDAVTTATKAGFDEEDSKRIAEYSALM